MFVEVGPSQALAALVRQHRTAERRVPRIVSLLGRAAAPGDAAAVALAGLGDLWSAGVAVAWPVPAGARRVPLPTYPFAGATHWFPRRALAPASDAAALSSVANSFTAPAVAPATAAPVTPAAAALVVPAAIHTALPAAPRSRHA